MLQISLFGIFTIVTADTRIVVSTAKTRLLIAWLIAHPGVAQPRRILAQLLWPDLDPTDGLHNVRMALTFLRPILAVVPDLFTISQHHVTYHRHKDVTVDIEIFDAAALRCRQHRHRGIERCPVCALALQERIAQYGGEFLHGEDIDSSSDFAHWLDLERIRYASEVNTARWQLAQFCVATGDDVRAQVLLQQCLRDVPAHEDAHALLMTLYMRMNQRAAAVAQSIVCVDALRDVLGLAPSAATQQLIDAIRTQTWHPAAPRSAIAPPRQQFYGRAPELERLAVLLSDPAHRWVSIVGAGGIGKTTLARFCAAQHARFFRDGGAFVSLEQITDERSALNAIASAIGVQFAQNESLSEQLILWLQRSEFLLVLDNMEQLRAMGVLLVSILDACPGLTVLVTSRAALQVTVEYIVPLHGLPSAEGGDAIDNPAVALFLSRAQQINTERDWAREVPDIQRLCVLVGGSPLAIELAASMSRALPCAQIVAAVTERLGALTTEIQDTPVRHRQLTIVFDEFWASLDPLQRTLLHTIAVFRESFDSTAAVRVCCASIPDIAAATVVNMLHQYTQNAQLQYSNGRYSVHPMMRQYIAERMGMHNERIDIAHAQYYLGLLAEVNIDRVSPATLVRCQLLEPDYANIVAAWTTAWSLGWDAQLAAVARALHTVGICTGHVPAVADVLAAGAHACTAPAAAVQIQVWEARLRHRLGDYIGVERVCTQILAAPIGLTLEARVTASNLLSLVDASSGRGLIARERLEPLLELVPPTDTEMLADLCIAYGSVLTFSDLHAQDRANEFFIRAHGLCIAIDDWLGVAHCNIWIAYRSLLRGDIPTAIAQLVGTIPHIEAINDRRALGILLCHTGLLNVLAGNDVTVWLDEIRRGVDMIRAVSDYAGEFEGVHILITSLTLAGQYAEALAVLSSIEERILQHGNPMQRMMFTDAVAMLAAAVGSPVEAIAVMQYEIQHPATQAVYRSLRIALMESLAQQLPDTLRAAAAETATVLIALDDYAALRMIFTLAATKIRAAIDHGDAPESPLMRFLPKN